MTLLGFAGFHAEGEMVVRHSKVIVALSTVPDRVPLYPRSSLPNHAAPSPTAGRLERVARGEAPPGRVTRLGHDGAPLMCINAIPPLSLP